MIAEYGQSQNVLSHPSRVRGLKYMVFDDVTISQVAPFTGAWIEIGRCRDGS